MSAGPPCGQPDCPVPHAPPPRGLRTVVWPQGTRLRRGHPRHRHPAGLVPGVGDTRFAPLEGAFHTYAATTSFAALLESALHDAAPPEPAIRHAALERWAEAEVALTAEVRLVDLRDAELTRLGLAREELVSTTAAHYACTRRWAGQLHGRTVGGRPTHGLVWHSRQAELHARALGHRPALADVLDAHPAEVAVLWAPPAPDPMIADAGGGLGALADPAGARYVADLAAMLEIVIL